MKWWTFSGIFLILTGVLHLIVGFMLRWNDYKAMIREGFFNSIQNDTGRAFCFWFLVCGILLIILGCVLDYYIKQINRPAPSFVGYMILGLSVLVCMVEPVSGAWLFIPQAFIIIFADKKG